MTSKVKEKLMTEVALGEILGDYFLSTPVQDRKDHWDVAIKFDVKSIPHEDSMPYKHGLRWIEAANVNGDDGWLLGSANFIAFEEPDYWIFVPRKKLKDWVWDKCHGFITKAEFKKKPMPYKWHTREGRLDKVTMIPLIDLCYLGIIIRKPNA
jgi:hypothetical protein